MQLSSVPGLRIYGSAAGDRRAGRAGADAVPVGSISECAVSVLRTAKGPAQRAVLGGRRVCAGV